jgi:2-C-methyl-D-erythritol 2,4-cyclodiphosphate synthase
MRIGQGFDAHKFKEGDHIILGGITIPHDKGMAAHSDGDVLIHALCDALLGAMSLGDIGQHFPDSSEDFKGIDSRILLRKVEEMMRQRGLCLVNADMTLIAQQPKLSPYFNDMRDNLAADLHTAKMNVSIKATTTEQMGFCGRGEGIAAMATVLIG